MTRKFQRKIENFTCENCGKFVKGNGYTNHCPNCLWSKHVDNNPGDRENNCKGLMKPENAYFKNGIWYLIQCCQRCGKKSKIKIKDIESINKIEKILKNKTPKIL